MSSQSSDPDGIRYTADGVLTSAQNISGKVGLFQQIKRLLHQFIIKVN